MGSCTSTQSQQRTATRPLLAEGVDHTTLYSNSQSSPSPSSSCDGGNHAPPFMQEAAASPFVPPRRPVVSADVASHPAPAESEGSLPGVLGANPSLNQSGVSESYTEPRRVASSSTMAHRTSSRVVAGGYGSAEPVPPERPPARKMQVWRDVPNVPSVVTEGGLDRSLSSEFSDLGESLNIYADSKSKHEDSPEFAFNPLGAVGPTPLFTTAELMEDSHNNSPDAPPLQAKPRAAYSIHPAEQNGNITTRNGPDGGTAETTD